MSERAYIWSSIYGRRLLKDVAGLVNYFEGEKKVVVIGARIQSPVELGKEIGLKALPFFTKIDSPHLATNQKQVEKALTLWVDPHVGIPNNKISRS